MAWEEHDDTFSLEYVNDRQGVEIARLRTMCGLLNQGLRYELPLGAVLMKLKNHDTGEVWWTTDSGKTKLPSAELAIRTYMGWPPMECTSNVTAAVIAITEIQVAFHEHCECTDDLIDALNGIIDKYRQEISDVG